jgi:hypothetical protein
MYIRLERELNYNSYAKSKETVNLVVESGP